VKDWIEDDESKSKCMVEESTIQKRCGVTCKSDASSFEF